jgi:hypothetical protein
LRPASSIPLRSIWNKYTMVVSLNMAQNSKNFVLNFVKNGSPGTKISRKIQNTHSRGVKKFASARFEQFLVPTTMLFDKLHTKSKVPAIKYSFHGIYASLRGRFLLKQKHGVRCQKLLENFFTPRE